MADFWGPGLDAELAYRHERLFTALRHTPYGDTHDQRGGEHDDLRRGDHARARLGSHVAARDRRTARRVRVQPARPKVSAPRGWLLRGSESWHAAR